MSMDSKAAVDHQVQQQLPRIDFSGVDLSNPGTAGWNALRSQVMHALCSYGCFEALYDSVSQELRRSLLAAIMNDLFTLPLQVKLKNTSEKPFYGYLGQMPGLDFESLAIEDPTLPHGVPNFIQLLWPDGNPDFCEALQSFSTRVEELEEAVRRMVLESLGVDKYQEDLSAATWYLLRFWEYGAGAAAQQQEQRQRDGEEEAAEKRRLGYIAHQDTNTMSIVCQLNEENGLEVETKDGQWILTTPSPISFIVMAGNAFRAWSNERVRAPMHRITLGGEGRRYSLILFSVPKNELVIQAPAELVDEDHPRLFNPYHYDDYLQFHVSEEGLKAQCKLTAFCGVAGPGRA